GFAHKARKVRIPLLGKGGVRGRAVNIVADLQQSIRKLIEPPLAPPLPRRGVFASTTLYVQSPHAFYTSAKIPVLSPTLSCATPALFKIVNNRFAMGVFGGYLMCRPPFILPAAPPATRTGSGEWLCTLLLLIALP